MRKGSLSKKDKWIIVITLMTVLWVIFAIISNSSVSVKITNKSKIKDINIINLDEKISNGLPPKNRYNIDISIEKTFNKHSSTVGPIHKKMYGFNVYPGPEGSVWFDIEKPGKIYYIAEVGHPFLTGGTWTADQRWLGVDYGSGVLWEIDPETGDMCSIGGGGTGMNGLAYDLVTNRLYGSSDDDYLYEINPENGEQEQIGPFGSGVTFMIGMAFDSEGVLYGWDLGSDKLWTIDTDTGEAEEVGPLGIDLNYAQDGDFDKKTDTLYLTAYTNTGQLYKCDKNTGECELIGNFEDGAEITCSMIQFSFLDHDVGIKSINYPENGYAIPEIPMQVTVHNYGNTTETTDVQMQIKTFEDGPIIFEEDFSGTFPPEGWETDFWNKSYTNVAGGTSPEARVYNYDQYYESQYYDNYIISNPIDCTGIEKVNLRFRWAADYEYPQYSSVYVKFRSNYTRSWRDITPWNNPVGQQQDGKLYEIDCYSFGKQFGEGFQIKWEYIGYYYYYNYLWLDDIEIKACNSTIIYNETVEDIEIQRGEDKIVDFPKWNPENWQDPEYEDTWDNYLIKACTLLWDDRPINDCKEKLLDLYYPWMHDIEVMSINSPHEEGRSMPAQTFPVQATMRNVGQYAECCIPIDLSITEVYVIRTLFSEYDWPGSGIYYPGEYSGWTDQHKVILNYYGFRRSYSANAGGEPYEAYLPYYYSHQDYKFYSSAIDVSEYDSLQLNFKAYNRGYTSGYTLHAGYSYDTITWYTAWSVEPAESTTQTWKVKAPIVNDEDTIYIGFWWEGYGSFYWYIDDIELVVISLEEEYLDFACQGPDIEPGQEITFTFDDWTPDFLQYKTTGKKDYIVEALIELEGDKNTDNNIKTELFTLVYWHDVGIDRITSPVGGGHPRLDELVWDNGEPDGVNGLFFGQYSGYDNWLIDDFEITQKTDITGIKLNLLWGPGYSENLEKMWICIVEETGECDPDPADPPYALIECTDFVEYTTGNFYFSRPEVVVEAEFEVVTLQPGTWWIGAMPVGIADAYAYWLTAPMQNCVGQWHAEYLGYPRWSPVSHYGYYYNFAWSVYGESKVPKIKAWIQPGTEDIDAVVKNYGTFTKEDLTAYAQIREYITDPENGTEVYTDEIGNIDIMEPLGGEKNLQFSDFTFSDEGRYGLYIQLPADPDDVQKNNEVKYGVAVDDTRPYCDPEPILDPPEPDGCEGWYVSDVTVTLNAYDPLVKDVSSGIKEIRYTINDGPEQVIPGHTGQFVLADDCNDIFIEYWAIDNVGNVEIQKNNFTIDIDQSAPNIKLDYELIGGNKLQGWKFEFTAEALDTISGMDYVEFYLNGLLQETIIGPGPTYQWTFTHPEGVYTIIKAIAYDNAGLFCYDEIENPETSYRNVPKNNNYQYSIMIIFKEFLDRLPFLQKLLDILEDFN